MNTHPPQETTAQEALRVGYPRSMPQAPKLAQAIRHPLRVAILRAMSKRRMTATDLANELAVPSGHLSYHVRQLHQLGLLVEDGAEIRGGAIEWTYVLDADALDEGQNEIHALLS
jgi:predicted transcriptional regulator